MGKFKTDESVFNVAVEYLKRLMRAFDMCDACSTNGNMEGWIKWTRNGYRILCAKMGKEEMDKFEERFEQIYRLFNNKRKRITKKREIMKKLDELDIALRQKAQEKGMLLPSKNDPKFAILER